MSQLLAPNEIIAERYKVIGYLAEGGMQQVYIAEDMLMGRRVALKTPKNKSASKRFKRSAIVAAKVNHPNVAKTFDYVQAENREFLVEELVSGADLRTALLSRAKFVDPYLAAKIFHHVAKGVAAAHHAGIFHRDLKPTNIMVVGDYSLSEIKVTDFGIAKMIEDELIEAIEGGDESITTSQTAVGALPYMAPELIDTPKQAEKPADIWSIGAMMYHLMCGDFPFGSGLKAVSKIVNATQPPETPAFLKSNPQFAPLATDLVDIMNKCFQKDPAQRPTADELVQMCGQLCYTSSERKIGQVYKFQHGAWGFISDETGQSTFFHKDSVYGELPSIDSEVVFSSYLGGGADRAFPVQKLSPLPDVAE